jgi:predicted nucleotidyltransferase
MIFDENFIDFINLLNDKKTKFVLVGGMAVVIHGVTRTTKDMDIFYERTEENCEKVLGVINEFGFQSLKLTVEDLMDSNGYIQLGHEPIRIDLFCDMPGVDFEEVFNASADYSEDRFSVKVIHINHLIENKRKVGRDQDLSDVKKLQKLINKKK